MYATTARSEVRQLEREDIDSILARNSVGRLAFARGEQIDVLPIQYFYRDGAIYGRTAVGGKLAQLRAGCVKVAFEVDEIRSSTNWRSVLIHGTFQLISRADENAEWVRALGIVRMLHRAALRFNDPRPERTEIFRIMIHDASGRALD